MMPSKGGKPCKFGKNCRNYLMGKCGYLHDHDALFEQPPNGGRGGRGGGFKPFPEPHNKHPNSDADFCRYFQVGECKSGATCKRAHEFVKGNVLRRVFRNKQVPNNEVSKLCLLSVDGAPIFALRLGDTVAFFRYDSELGQINELSESFKLEGDIHFFDAHEKYLYFASENKNTSFTNIGFIDVATKQRFSIDNAHKLKVTGMVHISDNHNVPLVLSASLDGTIKVWRTEGEKMAMSQ
jgi:hypothetical protein